MFAPRYFNKRYFNGRWYPPLGDVVEPMPPFVGALADAGAYQAALAISQPFSAVALSLATLNGVIVGSQLFSANLANTQLYVGDVAAVNGFSGNTTDELEYRPQTTNANVHGGVVRDTPNTSVLSNQIGSPSTLTDE